MTHKEDGYKEEAEAQIGEGVSGGGGGKGGAGVIYFNIF